MITNAPHCYVIRTFAVLFYIEKVTKEESRGSVVILFEALNAKLHFGFGEQTALGMNGLV